MVWADETHFLDIFQTYSKVFWGSNMKFFQTVWEMFGGCFGIIPGSKKGSKDSKKYVSQKNQIDQKWSRITSQSFSDPQEYHISSPVLFYDFSDF